MGREITWHFARGQALLNFVIMYRSQSDLFEVVGTLGATCGLAHSLYCGKYQGDQNSYDRQNDKQFYQREPTGSDRLSQPSSRSHRISPSVFQAAGHIGVRGLIPARRFSHYCIRLH
jgi:hypothetical protein